MVFDGCLSFRPEVIGTTDDHPFWVVGKGWVTTIDLSIGDQIETADGGIVVVEQIVFTERIEETYNIEVADYHTYYVTELGIWVHNSDKCVPKGVKLTGKGKKKIGNLRDLKDTDAAKAILDRGGNAGNVSEALGDKLKGKTVGEIANMAAKGDSAAETALKIIKQAAKKGQKY